MESKVQKQIVDYFLTFEEFHNTSKGCLKTCQKCAIAINKLIQRCNNIKKADLFGTPLEDFADVRPKLLNRLLNLITIEINEIRNQGLIIEEAFDKLCTKANTVKESCREIDFSVSSLLVDGTSLQPPLKQLLEFIEDSITYGSQFHSYIESSLKTFELKGLDSGSQVDNFKISIYWQRRVAEIIAYTSFCPENKVL